MLAMFWSTGVGWICLQSSSQVSWSIVQYVLAHYEAFVLFFGRGAKPLMKYKKMMKPAFGKWMFLFVAKCIFRIFYSTFAGFWVFLIFSLAFWVIPNFHLGLQVLVPPNAPSKKTIFFLRRRILLDWFLFHHFPVQLLCFGVYEFL